MTKADQRRFLGMDSSERERLKKQNPDLFKQLDAWETAKTGSSRDDLAQSADRHEELRSKLYGGR